MRTLRWIAATLALGAGCSGATVQVRSGTAREREGATSDSRDTAGDSGRAAGTSGAAASGGVVVRLGPPPAANETENPWAMFPGRIGRLITVNGELLAVFPAGGDDDRYVGRISFEDHYGERWIESRLEPAGSHAPPAEAIVFPYHPRRLHGGPRAAAYRLTLGASVDVHELSWRSTGSNLDDLVSRGFRVTACAGAGGARVACEEGDPFVVGPLTWLDLPAPPTDPASDEVRTTYAAAHGGNVTAAEVAGLRARTIDPVLDLHWVELAREPRGRALLWVDHPSNDPAFFFRLEPTVIFVAGDSLFVGALDEPFGEARPCLQLVRFRAGRHAVTHALNPSRRS